MKKKLVLIFSALLFMLIGSATVSINYVLNGKAFIAFNFEDVDVYIANLNVNGINKYNSINENKDSFIINVDNGVSILDLYVTNNATEYDETITLKCNDEDLTGVSVVESEDNKEIIDAQEIEKYTYTVTNQVDTQELMCYIENTTLETINFKTKVKKVMFAIDGVTLNTPYKIVEGDVYGELPIIEEENYEFLGWFTEPTFENEVTSATVVGNQDDQVLYGKAELTTCEYSIGTEWTFDYTGGEQTFEVPCDGTYKLEVWGAQGGDGLQNGSISGIGGYGGYSKGEIILDKEENIFINVGGEGANGVKKVKTSLGGYNGGGNGLWDNNDDEASGGGGGATHIAKHGGTLSTFSGNISDLLIVAGGGSGGSWTNMGGSGGGASGTLGTAAGSSYAGTQTKGYAFGQGGPGTASTLTPGSGGGGGFYGGSGGLFPNSDTNAIPGAGGSGYIGSPILNNKSMYCYNCAESDDINSKTYSNTCSNSAPTSECSKIGNGYAKITYVSHQNNNCSNEIGKSYDYYYSGTGNAFNASCPGTYKLEIWGAQGGSETGVRESNNNGYSHIEAGGYGGYSVGDIVLTTPKKLYVYVGGEGGSITKNGVAGTAGYNGGGAGGAPYSSKMNGSAGGGGATHIATEDGVLSSLEYTTYLELLVAPGSAIGDEEEDEIEIFGLIIAAGGGGGASWYNGVGSGGGFKGVGNDLLVGATQSSGYSVGLGKSGSKGISGSGNAEGTGGGGGGYYGGLAYSPISGKTAQDSGGTGGSGYIGNSILTNKSMYCYNCEESNKESTKTISTTCTNVTPTSNCAKEGNGHARITYLG